MKENAIIINGVKHTFIESKQGKCSSCSLFEECKSSFTGFICDVFEDNSHKHFEILKQE